MLQRIFIKNYALIRELDLPLEQGFTAITGETGSGKSILLGALGLVLGERADTHVLFEKDLKCIVEADFLTDKSDIKMIFKGMDLDYSRVSTFRREINPAGRSRAFVNDTPVSLSQLRQLSDSLIDIHSQHQTLLLNSEEFQLSLLDLFASHGTDLKKYQETFTRYQSISAEIKELKSFISGNNIDKDYLQFQLDELNEIELKEGLEEELAEELGLLENAEQIKVVLSESEAMLNSEKGLLDQLRGLTNKLSSISEHTKGLEDLASRLVSTRLELDDIAAGISDVGATVALDPERHQIVSDIVDSLQKLFSKHRVNSSKELINFRSDVEERLTRAEDASVKLSNLELELSDVLSLLVKQSKQLTENRTKAKDVLIKDVSAQFGKLSLNNARIDALITPTESFSSNGKDQVSLLFNANKGGQLEELSKVASGGELSRLMLILKSRFAKVIGLPTLIFDEIDAGVSGEIASQMAAALRSMSKGRQVIAITHIPQVAARAQHHLQISKSDDSERSITSVEILDQDQRILELAKMLSGTQVSEASVANARELLKN